MMMMMIIMIPKDREGREQDPGQPECDEGPVHSEHGHGGAEGGLLQDSGEQMLHAGSRKSEMPLEIHRTIPVRSTGQATILWKIPLTSENALEHATDNPLVNATENPQ